MASAVLAQGNAGKGDTNLVTSGDGSPANMNTTDQSQVPPEPGKEKVGQINLKGNIQDKTNQTQGSSFLNADIVRPKITVIHYEIPTQESTFGMANNEGAGSENPPGGAGDEQAK